MTRKLELVGISEIAEMAGISRNTLAQRVKRGKLPEPVAVLKAGKIWLRSDIEAWLSAGAAKD